MWSPVATVTPPVTLPAWVASPTKIVELVPVEAVRLPVTEPRTEMEASLPVTVMLPVSVAPEPTVTVELSPATVIRPVTEPAVRWTLLIPVASDRLMAPSVPPVTVPELLTVVLLPVLLIAQPVPPAMEPVLPIVLETPVSSTPSVWPVIEPPLVRAPASVRPAPAPVELLMLALAFRVTLEPSELVTPPVLDSWPVPAAPEPRVKVLPEPTATWTVPLPLAVPSNSPEAAWLNFSTLAPVPKVKAPSSDVVVPISVEAAVMVVPPI